MPLVNGGASFTTSSLSPGAHTITTIYGGDANFNGSTGTVAQTVIQANAGIGQTIDEGGPFTLDGSASVGSGLSFAWTQLAPTDASRQAVLASPNGVTTGATAPFLALGASGVASQMLTFQLTVTLAGASSTATVNVVVRNVNAGCDRERSAAAR